MLAKALGLGLPRLDWIVQLECNYTGPKALHDVLLLEIIEWLKSIRSKLCLVSELKSRGLLGNIKFEWSRLKRCLRRPFV